MEPDQEKNKFSNQYQISISVEQNPICFIGNYDEILYR